jgi:prepilin-type N-terminal cleavage/methylation domain-containing protein
MKISGFPARRHACDRRGERTYNQPSAVRRRTAARRGFTLIEAAMTTVIIGVAFMALLQLLAAGTVSNNKSGELTTAVTLANNINEWTVRTAYADLRDIAGGDGRTYDLPVDGRGIAMAGFEGWNQVVTINYVDPFTVTAIVPDEQVEPISRVSVVVNRNGQPVYTTSWLVGAGVWPPVP